MEESESYYKTDSHGIHALRLYVCVCVWIKLKGYNINYRGISFGK